MSNLPPGPELDALIAEKVTGFWDTHAVQYGVNEIPKYSTDISAAWQVIDKMSLMYAYQIDAVPYGDIGIVCTFTCESQWRKRAETAPHAICLAALATVGYNAVPVK